MSASKSYVILFVEGETEKEFYEELIKFYRLKSITPILSCKVYNVKGISRFENKVSSRLKLDIIPKHPNKNLKVVCCYDTDVFELAQKPRINWRIIEKKINELGINEFYEIKAVRMIEDWFLKDLDGLCKYLGIEIPNKIDGKTGYEKIKTLFKKGKKPKVYQKGSNSHKFIPSLNIMTIRNNIKEDLTLLEKALGVKLKTK